MTQRKQKVTVDTVTPEVVITNQQTVKLDVAITMSDLAKMVRSNAREVLIARRAEILKELKDAQDKHNKLGKELEEAANKLGKAQTKCPVAMALAQKLSAFLEEKYEVEADVDVVDLSKQKVKIRLSVVQAKKSRYFHREFSKEMELEFTAEMNKVGKQLEEAAKVVNSTEVKLEEINQRIADLPILMERAEAALMHAYLKGELKTGKDLLCVLEATQPKDILLLDAPTKK